MNLRFRANLICSGDDGEQGFRTGQNDRERNTLVARMAWHPDAKNQQELGFSVLAGDVRNHAGQDTRRNAPAVRYQAPIGRFKMMLQALRYRYKTSHEATQTYGGLDPNSFVMVGGFGYPYPVASKCDIYIVNLSRDIPGSIGPFSGFRVYNDYSVLHERVSGYRRSVQNVTGLSFSAGKWLFYAYLMMGKHHPYMSPDFGGLASTSRDHPGHSRRINLQAGYDF